MFSLIDVSGDDAAAFLQGQLTQDLTRLASAPGLPAAWCNAKGRVIAVMRLIGIADDRFGLVVPASSADTLVKRLSMFRLRARVDIERRDEGWLPKATRFPDDLAHLESLGLRPEPDHFAARRREGIVAFSLGGATPCIELFGPADAFEDSSLDLREPLDEPGWRAALVAAGVPYIEGESSEKFTAHMLNLDLLGAISFSKGCYAGQEVIARTAHLGQSKRRLARYRLESGAATAGDKLQRAGHDAGDVLDACGAELLAVVPLELSGQTLSLHGHAAVPVALPYAVPGAA
jgi:folate-binding protein YgfZ